MDIKEEKKAIKNLKAYLMDEWELTEEQKDEFDNLVFRVLAVGKEEAKAQAVPEGFVLVPKEPSEQLLSKAIRKYLQVSDLSIITSRMAHLYELMIQEAMIEAQEQKG